MHYKKIILFLGGILIGLNLQAQSSWKTLTELADSLDLQLKFDESLPIRIQAMQAGANQAESTQTLLRGLKMFTEAELRFEETKKPNREAYQQMQEAVQLMVNANAEPERLRKAYWDLNLAAFNYMRDQADTEKFLNKSIEYHLKCAEIDTIFLLNTMHGSSYMGILSGRYAAAIETLEDGINLFNEYQTKSDKENDLKGYLYSNLALVYSSQFLNIPQKEIQYLQEAEKVFAAMEEPDLEYYIDTYITLSKIERQLRNYRNAEGYLNRALNLYEKHKDRFHQETMHDVGVKKELDIYHQLVIIHRETGHVTGMQQAFQRAEQIARQHPLDQTEKNQYAGILRSMAGYYLHHTKDLEQASALIDRALAIQIERTTIHLGDAATGLQTDRAYAYLLKKEYHRALRLIEQLEVDRSLRPYQIEVKTKSLLGLRRLDAAVQAVNQLLTTLSEENQNFRFPESDVGDFVPGPVIADAEGLADLAEAFRAYHGKYTISAEKLYWMALAQLESNRSSAPLSNALKKTFDKIVSGLMDAALERRFSTAENNRLLTFMERIASSELIHNFLLKRELAGQTDLYKLVEEEQFIRSYLTLLKKRYQQSGAEDDRQELFDKEIELQNVQKKLSARFAQSNIFTVPDVDVSVPNDKQIIKFQVAGDALYRICLFQGQVTYGKINDYPTLKTQIEQFLTLLGNLETPSEALMEGGKRLFSHLLSDDFASGPATVIIPDDILHYLPFELLVKDQAYLIEHHTVSYASNFYFLTPPVRVAGRGGTRKVAFFAPAYTGAAPDDLLAVRGAPYSLQGAEGEVRRLATFVAGQLYIGDDASKSRFKALEGDLSVLHLAMHSNLDDSDPELSSLLFSSSEPDFKMYISELYGMNFRSDLAVLSACNTGVGGFADGGNLVSMHHAFTAAGIPATVASLWNAPDQATEEIMIAFYRNLSKGQDKATALREAKLHYLQHTADDNLRHPFYWAGFVLSGDESPVSLAAPRAWWQKPFPLAVLFLTPSLVLVAVIFRKKIKAHFFGL